MIEEGKHNAVSRLVWQHWLKTGLPLTRREAKGELADCELVTFNLPRPVKGWVPTREWIRRQFQRLVFSITFDGTDHDDFL